MKEEILVNLIDEIDDASQAAGKVSNKQNNAKVL